MNVTKNFNVCKELMIIIVIVATIFLAFTTTTSENRQELLKNVLYKDIYNEYLPENSTQYDQQAQLDQSAEYQLQKEQFINHIRNIPIPTSGNRFPIYANPVTNSWTYTGIGAWTAGYYPALLWWVYEQTGNSADLTKAISTTNQYAALDNVNIDTHDQYIAALPYIKGLKHVNNTIWKNKALSHANRLVNVQFNPVIGAVPMTTTSRDVISDSMSAGTVPLLIWSYKNSPSESDKINYINKLKSHVNVVTRDHFKSDNSGAVWQSVHYNSNGTVAYKHNHQAEDNGPGLTWARGQAWFMYGMSELYDFALYLNDPGLKNKYIQLYNKSTSFWIRSLNTYSDNGVMKNTIGMTTITGKYDTSGTAIATSSLFKMYRLTGNSNYLNIATKSFGRMISTQYFNNGRLLHGFYAPQVAQDAELIWGDYYLSETFDRNAQLTNIVVTSPNGGENWQRGETKSITWKYAGNPGPNVKIELWKSGVLKNTINSYTPNDGSYNWTIPTSLPYGIDYKIKIKSTSTIYSDMSNNNFKIY